MNIIIVMEDSDLYINFSHKLIIFLTYSVQTIETCGARHVVPTNFLLLFLSPTISPSPYEATTPIYGGRARHLRRRREAVEAVRGRARMRGAERSEELRVWPPWSEGLLRKFCFVRFLFFQFLT
jgi:hypothetical protein